MNLIRLIVGLGNPGADYSNTRHNAGFWFVDAIADKHRVLMQTEGKFFGIAGKFKYQGQEVFLLKPSTFMNLSGKAVLALAQFYKIELSQILVVHDELDFEPGVARLKFGGGNGGHNGLKDITRIFGPEYWRLRLGIGHPGDKNMVHDYVLHKPSVDDKISIGNAIDNSKSILEYLINAHFEQALKQLHTKTITIEQKND